LDRAKHNILIIDDQKTNISALSRILRPEFNIFAAGNGRDALMAARECKPAVILLDIQMEDMDGFEVIGALKNDMATKDVPVIFITGRADLESEERGLAMGAADYIRKPYSGAIVRLRLQNQIKMLEMTIDLKSSAERLEQALEDAQEATRSKSNFLSNMSHEIRTPMNAITGMGEILQHEALNERQRGYVNDIVISANSLLGIINDILDFSKIESGKIELLPIDYYLGAFIDQIKSMFSHIAQQKGLEFKVMCGHDLPEVLYGDDLRLRQALTNILGNAMKFTEEGHVHMCVSALDGNLIFEISDTGVGITKDEQPKLFKAFEQVDKAMNRNVVGTGLGLIISKSFVELMGGSISFESEYGQGAVFTVVIPAVLGSMERAVIKEETTENYTISCPEAEVLVADDNEFNLKVAGGLLKLLGIEADTADSGKKAIELVKKNDYDLVFMDHMMPELDGVEATAVIRGLGGKYERLPVIALTANAVRGAKEMFLANGFHDFISKPIDVRELIGVLEKWLPPEKVRARADLHESRDRIDKDDELHRKSIITFVKENRNTYEKIYNSLAYGDLKTAHRIAHTLKSSAGYLGRKGLQDASLSLESSLQSEPPTYTKGQLNALKIELEKALFEYETVFQEAESVKTEAIHMDNDALAGLLSELKPLLEKNDFGASGYVERLQGVAGMENLAELIDDFDYDGALELLNESLASL